MFVPLKTLRVAEETIKAEEHSKEGRKTVVVTFGEGSMGLEFAPRRRGGGCVLLQLIKGGVADKLYRKRLRKSMRLMSINAENVAHLHFDDVLNTLKTASRPIKLQFLSAPHRPGSAQGRVSGRVRRDGRGRGRGGRNRGGGRGHRSKSPPTARRSSGLVEKTFEAGSLGIEFVAKKKGGVLVKNIVPNSQSAAMVEPPLRKAMTLTKVGSTDVELWSLKEVLARIGALPRPLVLTFKIAPGKDWTKRE